MWAKLLDLARWNQLWSSRLASWQIFCVSFCLSLLIFVVPAVRRGEWRLPPRPGDAPDYDSIAMGLLAGHGFSLIGGSTEYLKPYRDAPEPEKYAYLFRVKNEPRVTAYRPPLLSMLIAVSYQAFGRDFGPVRAMNCAFMAAAGGIAAALVFRVGGVFPAAITSILFSFFDERTREYARELLTESLATFLVMLLVSLFIMLAEKKRLWQSLALGAVAGLAVLARSAFVMWLPGFILLVYWLCATRETPWISRLRWMPVLLFLAGFFLLCGPWFVRNCIVLEGLMPTGTQGHIALGSAYSDKIFETQGNWYSLNDDYYAPIPGFSELEGIEKEKQMAIYSKAQATRWIQEHPGRLPELIALKLHRFWRAKHRFDVVVLICGGLGLVLMLNRWEGVVLAAFLLLNTAQVAATYAAYGRFQVPLCPILNALAGVGIWTLIVCLTSGRKEVARWLQAGGKSEGSPEMIEPS